MADIQNTFIKSKMNKDLDDRLVPTGEYRNAQNISISRSEGSDVGALENILGNSVISSTVLNIPNIDVIGFLSDNSTNNIYLFLTDYIDNSVSGISNFAPSNASCIISRYNTSTKIYTKLVQGRFLNFAKNNSIIGVNILEDLLFFTDNRNQPRKINVDLANPNNSLTPTYYVSEDTISVAKPAPLKAIKLTNIAQGLPLESTMKNPAQEFMPDDTTPNPDYNVNWAGDPNFLQDKFVRFSYRYKFDDGEYSIIAPFTQPCFIPKQQGYFLNGDQDEAYRSTIVQFVENNVTQIGLNIPFETTNPDSDLHITDLEILYKESDGLAIKVVESVPINNVLTKMQSNVDKTVYDFTYISTKPYKTLPADQTTRVYDMVPVKALAQEVSGNRVIYGNFYNRMSPPKSIDYGVGYSLKLQDSQIEYPNHTAKQNRNYQIGIVLSDKFGRQSSVILSSRDKNSDATAEEGVQYGSSTIYLPYYNGSLSDILNWPGYGLRVLFNKAIPCGNINVNSLCLGERSDLAGYPGLYSETNPLGWYSYKIVVRQQEQDYYNVFLPGILNGYPSGTTNFNTEIDQTANIVLINDNINKIPRDLSEVGPDQRQYRSSVQIFGRVTPDPLDSTLNKQYKPGILSDTVVSISTVNDTNYNETQGVDLVYPEFYQSETNPLIGRVSTQQSIGVIGSATYNVTLGVYETSPVVSLLDIYWETSTTGLISELNQAINSGFVGPYFINLNGGYNQNEGMTSGTKVVSGGFTEDSSNVPITTQVNFSFSSVIDGNGVDRTNEFTLSKTLNSAYQFDIATNGLFYYGSNSSYDLGNRSFTFTINCQDVVGGTTEQLQFTGSVQNVAPTITNCVTELLNRVDLNDPWTIYTFQGNNGSLVDSTQGLTWSISSVSYNGEVIENNNLFIIDEVSGVLTNPNGTAEQEGNYQITVNLEDAGGLTSDPCELKVTFGLLQVTTRYFNLRTPHAGEWVLEWEQFNKFYQTLQGPATNGVQDTRVVDVPANNVMTANVTLLNSSLLYTTTYRFMEDDVILDTQTKSSGFSGTVSYTFNNVKALSDYRVSVEYGVTDVTTYYGLKKCETGQSGFRSTQTTAQQPGLVDRDLVLGGDGFYYTIDGLVANPVGGGIGFTVTGEQDCPPVYNYYILKPACFSSSQELYVKSLDNLNKGENIRVFSNCYDVYDIDSQKRGTQDVTGANECSC